VPGTARLGHGIWSTVQVTESDQTPHDRQTQQHGNWSGKPRWSTKSGTKKIQTFFTRAASSHWLTRSGGLKEGWARDDRWPHKQLTMGHHQSHYLSKLSNRLCKFAVLGKMSKEKRFKHGFGELATVTPSPVEALTQNVHHLKHIRGSIFEVFAPTSNMIHRNVRFRQ